ncbi:hypothetical protein EJO66_32160 [Variovorax beijingensis]|uniref:Uncharacterized protein n=1 Tax=Variovorax beijingensis TaxID=2496117 RepID=A0ABX9ZXC7_9BURK|nr:hypothetical protein [Variovorax beijingensis]RSZ24084.1 hypothetical protein EJO66_32160 [Variovorax beijingensis]
MTESTLSLSKFDAAERQLLLAIRLFFAEEDPVSIHTLAESAGQVLHDVGKDLGVVSLVRDYELILPEKKRDWLAAIFKARNFFKHADKDPNGILEFRPSTNDFSLIDAVGMYSSLKQRFAPETIVFLMWFAVRYPELVVEESDLGQIVKKFATNGITPDAEKKENFLKMIGEIRSGEISVPNVAL